MNLRVLRLETDEHRTIGALFIENRFDAYVLEDSVHLAPGSKGCIPKGVYRVVITPSQRFGRPLPLLVNVPGFDGIRIHPGNTDKDTAGCLLLGRSRGTDSVVESAVACAQTQRQIQAALDKHQDVWISVENLW